MTALAVTATGQSPTFVHRIPFEVAMATDNRSQVSLFVVEAQLQYDGRTTQRRAPRQFSVFHQEPVIRWEDSPGEPLPDFQEYWERRAPQLSAFLGPGWEVPFRDCSPPGEQIRCGTRVAFLTWTPLPPGDGLLQFELVGEVLSLWENERHMGEDFTATVVPGAGWQRERTLTERIVLSRDDEQVEVKVAWRFSPPPPGDPQVGWAILETSIVATDVLVRPVNVLVILDGLDTAVREWEELAVSGTPGEVVVSRLFVHNFDLLCSEDRCSKQTTARFTMVDDPSAPIELRWTLTAGVAGLVGERPPDHVFALLMVP